jgi:hypothetical protein
MGIAFIDPIFRVVQVHEIGRGEVLNNKTAIHPMDPLFKVFFFDVSPAGYRGFMKYSQVRKQLPEIAFGGSAVGVSYLDA